MTIQSLFEVPGFYSLIPFTPLRETPGVVFDNVPLSALPRIDAIDRVLHDKGAISPGPVDDIATPWYMHPHQDDNLIVLYGVREVDIFKPGMGPVQHFTVSPNCIWHNDTVIYEGGAMLVWPKGVFHRIRSGAAGSASLNFAVHYPGFNIRTNFNIYDLDTQTGKFRVIREGHHDQPGIEG